MKPATLIDPEEGQPLLDSSTTRRATPKVLAAVVALGLLGAVAVASSQVAPSSPVQAFDTAPLCDSTVETSVVNYTIPGLVNVFNAEWDSLAQSTGLDPYMNVINTDINIPKDYFCDESCALDGGGSCTKSFVKLDLTEMTGLGDFVLETIDQASMTVNTDDTSCGEPDGATCAFAASFPITAKLSSGSTLELTFSNLDFQCKCKGPFGGAYQQTPVNLGTETCKSTDAKATGTLSVCFAGCSPGGAITSAAITSFKISDSTTVTCDSNEGFWAEVQSWLIPQFAGDIYGAVNAPIEDAINGEFTTLIDDYNLDTCGSS